MKSLLIIVVVLMLSVPVYAADEFDYCPITGGIAEEIMKFRQNNFPMSDLMSTFNDIEKESLKSGKEGKRMVIDAYQEQAWSSKAMKREAIQKFRNKWEMDCYASFQ